MKDEPIDADLGALLKVERGRPGMPADTERALLSRLEATLGLPMPGGAPPGAGPNGGAAPPKAAPLAPNGAIGRAALTISRGRAIGALLAAFATGGIAGGVATRAVSKADAPSTTIVAVTARAPSATDSSGSTAAAPKSEIAPAPPPIRVGDLPDVTPTATVVGSSAPKEAAGSDEDLATERSLIEVARAATSRGNAADALAALDEHARRFPRGRMTEEREALRIVALARAGREGESRERREDFQRHFPKSLMLPPAPSSQASAAPSLPPR